MNLAKFERYPLTFAGPTPMSIFRDLSAAIGADVEIYAKRDDCNSGLALGGQQVAQARIHRARCDCRRRRHAGLDRRCSVHHTRMVAATAAKIGMKCVVVQESWVPHDDAVYDRVGNILLTRLMGADSRLVDEGFDIGIRQSWEDAMQSVRDKGGVPYPIPAGASVHKYGGLGYVGFAEEVRTQEAELGFKFDYIIVCVVTGSTQAGMIVGFAADDRADRVIGIDGSGTPEQLRAQVRGIVDNTAELVELGREVRDDEIVINPDYAYPAYGVPSHETNEAIRLAARTEAMITDPVYEGKSMQGMIDLAKKGFFPKGSKVLYAHLGGAPALNGYS
jgi:1-aminocyclopropane-1-carboxylate deaminase